MRRILSLPFLVILMGLGAAAMYLPAIYAYGQRDMHVARAFFYGGTLFLILTAMIGLALGSGLRGNQTRNHLLALLAAFSVLPMMLAAPFAEAVPDTTYLNAYFEMVSSLTTTGATLFDDPGRLPEAVHLWRALVGWMGGFLVWLMAIAILAPINLGGFEVTSAGAAGQSQNRFTQIGQQATAPERLTRYARQLFPVYAFLTAVLWFFLYLAGDRSFVAAIHAMSTLATSGVSPVGGMAGSASGPGGEMLIFLFFAFAISRRTFLFERASRYWPTLLSDPEFRMGLLCVASVPAVLILRHWLGAYEVDEEQNLMAALRAFWGSMFTVLSFLTTTGFESVDWGNVRAWSGLHTPGLLLVGLALIGGGVGTTAGGAKLLRVYALYKHGAREVERMVHPSSVGGKGAEARHIRREGAFIAWVFFLLFALSIAAVMVLLALTGLGFQAASIFAIAAFTTTGPLAQVAADAPLSYTELGDWAKIIVIFAMVLGRLGTLSIIALFNPDWWRA